MTVNRKKQRIWEFGPFRLDETERLLLRDGEPVGLTPKVFDTLVALLERSGRLVEKDELMAKLWPDTFVDEGALTRNISDLRKALGGERYVETVPKRGYRFVEPVRELTAGSAISTVEKATEAQLVIEEEAVVEAQSYLALAVEAAVAPRQLARRKTKATLLVLGMALAGLAFALFFLWPGRRSDPPATGLKMKTLAVLPFKPLDAGGGNDYLGLGITDTLITKLSNVHEIIVRPTSVVQKYAGQGFDPVAAGREQRVEAVLEGSIQKLGDKVRVTVRLLQTKDGAQLWGYQCDAYCTDIFAMQDVVSQRVATALLAQLTDEEKRLLVKRETGSDEAYQLYLKGRHFWNRRNAEGFRKAIEYFEQSIAQDPNYARAFAGLSDSYLLLWGYGFAPPAEAIPKAKETARKALDLDNTLAEAHVSLGTVAWNYDWDWAVTEREFRRAIELNPNYATAHHYLGEFLTQQGRFDEGWVEIGRAMEIAPTSLIINTDAGLILDFSRRSEEAIKQYRKTLEMDPNFGKARRYLAIIYTRKGMFEEAKAELEKFRQIDDSPGKRDWLMGMGDLYAYSGRREEARKAYEEVKRLAERGYVDPGAMMWMHFHLGKKDQTFAWMEKAYAERSTQLIAIKVNPGCDTLRSDPRFQDMLRRMRLAE
jgi:DNA-binding winged helix-turn-helix (wHTH) protein/TolB-like protein/Tfp pilus assembly protein PilF